MRDRATFAPVEHDVLILGRGIAGATLTEACRLRGLSVHVFDVKRPGNASMAAGGVVNPVVFRRDVLAWRAAEHLALARSFFLRWQERLGIACWHRAPVVKIFPTPNEVKQWERAMQRPETAPFLASRTEPEIDRAPLRAPHGYGTVVDGAWLDIPQLLQAQQQELLHAGRLSAVEVAHKEIHTNGRHISIGGVKGRWLVHCTGAFAHRPGLVPVKGETLTVRIPGLQLSAILHVGIGLMPLGNELYRAGATFTWEPVWDGPSAQARDELMGKLSALVEAPVELVAQHAGVRPTTRDRRPLLGMIGPREAVFNGLGTRGVMQAPWCAVHLLDHLFKGAALDPEVDPQRFC